MQINETAVARQGDQNRERRHVHVTTVQMASTISYCDTRWAAEETIVEERKQSRCTDSGRKSASSGSRLGQAAAETTMCSGTQRYRAFILPEDAHTAHG